MPGRDDEMNDPAVGALPPHPRLSDSVKLDAANFRSCGEPARGNVMLWAKGVECFSYGAERQNDSRWTGPRHPQRRRKVAVAI